MSFDLKGKMRASRREEAMTSKRATGDSGDARSTGISISGCDFSEFTYSKKSHFTRLRRFDPHADAIPELSNLKVYQDLLIYTFLLENFARGARILEIGGGNSRIIHALKDFFEFWNLDKLEGIGNGPTEIGDEAGFRLVRDYIGNFNSSIPDTYFDCVFSISVLEHVQESKDHFERICQDLDRVLKPGAVSVHCLDVVWRHRYVWTNPILYHLYANEPLINPLIPWSVVVGDSDLYVMSREAYDQFWMPTTRRSYQDFGKPFSYNLVWKKSKVSGAKDVDEEVVPSGTLQRDRKGIALPRISVVTPSFNQGQFLEECIDSVLSQDYPNLEYIIMDGGSSDNSVEIIKKYAKHLAYWQSKPDGGQYHALDDAFRRTTGDIMAWLNSDDKYHPGSLIAVGRVFSTHDDVEWITGRPTSWDAGGRLLRVQTILPVWTRETLRREQRNAIFPQQESTFWRQSLWKKAGSRLQTDLRLAADFELWVRFFHYADLVTVDALLGGYREHGDQRARTQKEEYIEETEDVLRADSVHFGGHAAEARLPAAPKVISVPVSIESDMNTIEDQARITSSKQLVDSLIELVGGQFDELREKEKAISEIQCAAEERLNMIEALRDVAEERLNMIEALRHVAEERLNMIEALRNTAEERLRILGEKEELIRLLHAVCEERKDVIELINEELETIKRHWAYRTAVRTKRLLEKVFGRWSP
jgi:ubiquinone/menaquinone biosynthesis C-methylase UbiE